MKRIGGVINRVVLDVLDVEFIPRVEHLLRKISPKKQNHINICDVCIYKTNQKEFCLRVHIESKNRE